LAERSLTFDLVVVGEIVPMKWRFLATGFTFAWAIPLSGLAPAISYAFIFKTSVGWRGIFYLLIALNTLCTAGWFFFYHPPTFHMKHTTGRKTQFIKEFDYIGSLLMALGLMLFLMGLSWGGALHPWNSAHVISTIVIGFLCLVAFFVYETFAPLKEPLLPTHLFRNRGWIVSVILWSVGASSECSRTLTCNIISNYV
jgi:MFS family permease